MLAYTRFPNKERKNKQNKTTTDQPYLSNMTEGQRNIFFLTAGFVSLLGHILLSFELGKGYDDSVIYSSTSLSSMTMNSEILIKKLNSLHMQF